MSCYLSKLLELEKEKQGEMQDDRNLKESLVPVDHFLRAVEATIDFSFIEEKLQPYYWEDK